MAYVTDMTRKTFGISRNITYRFKEIRAANGRVKGSLRGNDNKGNEKLLDNKDDGLLGDKNYAPEWVKEYLQALEIMNELEKELNILERLCREKNINAFKRVSSEQQTQLMNKYEKISQEILEVNLKVNKIKSPESSESEKQAFNNGVRSLKIKLKDLTVKFKKLQNAQKVNKPQILSDQVYNFCDDSEIEDGLVVLAPHINDGLNVLANNMIGLAEIFKELNDFVLVQGTIFDRIDCAIESTVANTKNSVTHLKGAEKHQRCTRATCCILFLLLTILILIIVLGLKVYL